MRSGLERVGRLGPLACQLEVFLTLLGIFRQLGRLNAVLGMLLVKLLQCRQVRGVIVLIMLLQRRYHRHLFISLLLHAYTRQMATRTQWCRSRLVPLKVSAYRSRSQCRMRRSSRHSTFV